MSIASAPPFVNDIGVDISKADFWAAVDRPDRDLHKLTAKKFPRTEQGARKFLEWARSLVAPEAAIRVVMEATGLYSEQLADLLVQIDPACRAVPSSPIRGPSRNTPPAIPTRRPIRATPGSSHASDKAAASGTTCLCPPIRGLCAPWCASAKRWSVA